jgi:hypothetical protein
MSLIEKLLTGIVHPENKITMIDIKNIISMIFQFLTIYFNQNILETQINTTIDRLEKK